MNEPEGWDLIEAWRSGSISSEDFAQLQQLLRDSPAARRTLRQVSLLDSALRDRSEANAMNQVVVERLPNDSLSPESPRPTQQKQTESVSVEIRDRESVTREIRWREVIAWSAAAIAIAIAIYIGWEGRRGASIPETTIESAGAGGESARDRRRSSDRLGASEPTPSLAQMRKQLLESSDRVMHLQLVTDNPAFVEPAAAWQGDIVWSNEQQFGFLRLPCTDDGNSTGLLYQLWIIASDSGNQDMIHAGAFPVEQCAGELIVPIQADQFIDRPRMFIVSSGSEQAGIQPSASLFAVVDQTEF